MTDVPTNYDVNYPALDGSNGINNITSSTTSSASNTNIVTAGSPNSSIRSINNNNNNTDNNNHHHQHQNHVTSGWSTLNQATSATQTNQQPKLNYLLLSNSQQQIQQLYQQQQQQPQHQQQKQQVLSHLGEDSDQHNSNAVMVSQYNIQPQQPQQNQVNKISMNNNSTGSTNTMQNNPSIQQKRPGLPNPIISSERCIGFKIASEERRHRNFELEQSKILKEIMLKTNTKIEVTTMKDGALNFCIIGKEQNLQSAKNFVLNDFQTSVTLTVSVPKSIHGRLLGPKGQRLSSIQDETLTKIAIPRKEDDSDVIKIVGLKSNAEQAVRSIEKYAREFAGKSVEKVSVERIYLLFITGPFNENLKRWEEMGAKVSTSGGILPSSNDRESGYADEVTFTIMGETTAVTQVKEEITQIYEDKKKKCTTVNMEVKKAQHKYILGPGGQNLRNLFAKTGVSVELPQESESETITLRGERSKLAPALSELYTQAHSETDDYFEADNWMHKYLIGPRKTNLVDFKARGVDVKSLEDKIKLHGPPTEVENVKDIFEAELETIRKTIIRKDIRVEARIHGYIIGKSGTTVDRIREESGAFVLVPKNDEPSEFITLEGTVEAVVIAEDKINAIAKKYEATRKLEIDQQLHGSIIGRKGEKIRSIREKFTQVVFTFPEQGSKNNEITILGPTDEVEACFQYLDEFHKQLQENNHQVQVPIKRDIIKYLPDAQHAIRRIKVDHRVKIDLHVNNNEDENKSAPTESKQQQQNATSATNESSINANNHNELNESAENKKKSGKSKANKNKLQQSLQPQQQQQSNGIPAKAGGDSGKNSESYAVVIGKKEDVDAAKGKVSKLFEELATTTEVEVKLPYKLRSLLGPKSKLYRQFLDEFQQKVVMSFPSQNKSQEKQQSNKQSASGDEVSNAETNGNSKNNANNNNNNRIDIVKIRGPKNIAKKAEKRFEALVAESQEKLDKNFNAQVTVETAVFEKFSYEDKLKLNKIRDSQSVKVKIPDAREVPQLQCLITGYEKNVQAALQQFNKLVDDVKERKEETIEIASQVHPRLIGNGGVVVKKLMEDFKVDQVKFARQRDPNPDSVTIIGRPDCITAAKNHMMKLADQYLLSASRANSNGANNNNNSTNRGNSFVGGQIHRRDTHANDKTNSFNNSQQQQQQATEFMNATGKAE